MTIEQLGTSRVVEMDGRWHVVALSPTGLFGLGEPQWVPVTAFGYRRRSRAERRARRVQRRKVAWHEKRARERAQSIARVRATDQMIRRALEKAMKP